MKLILAFVATASAVVPVDRFNWPGVVLSNDHVISPVASAPVDAGFNPDYGYNRFRYTPNRYNVAGSNNYALAPISQNQFERRQ